MRRTTKKKRGKLILNACGLVFAVVLLGYAFSANAPALLALEAENSLAAASVSISAGVAPNPDNTLAQQLQEKETQLDQQEQQVAQSSASTGSMGLYSLLASIALFLLVGINFYFDWRRGRRNTAVAARPLFVDLRAGK